MFIFSWLLVLSTRSVLVLYIVRIIQGLALGMLFTGLPLYVAEIADAKIRGALGYFFQGMWYVGNLYEYSIGPFVDYQTLALLSMIPPIVFVVTFSWFPESPYLLAMRGRHEEAAASLSWFRGSEEGAETELSGIGRRAAGEDSGEDSSRWDLVKTRAGIKSLLIVHMVGMTYTMSGGTAMFSYATETFSKTSDDHSGLSPDMVTILMGTLVLLFVPLSASIVDRFGRRPILLISSGGSFLCLGLASLYYQLRSTLDLSGISWAPYTLIVAYTVFIGSGVESVFPVLQAELFPDSTRGLASGVCHFNITLMSFFCLKMYKVVADGLGLQYLYATFSFFALLGAILIYFFIPETKGKTFTEIQGLL
ncbi:hypothetical protein AAG570_004755 [Ranatra chinensis]|uniref:Major facilitator superfamily (MFS) profile domain-containing protein n=1 Tax=Ranatra chinensis TaxID=642074 RepID=A0ABD0Y1R5_9HEMI